MEGISRKAEHADLKLIDLHLIGPLKACAVGADDILPSLRKARALFVVIALSDGQSAPRRYLANLLWSRADAAQALARLRDTLRSLKQALKETTGEDDLIRVDGDRVALRPGAVRVDIEPDRLRMAVPTVRGIEIATDLDGIDPALDAWLAALRGRLRKIAGSTALPAEAAVPAVAPRRGSVIGVSLINAVGPPGDDYLSFALCDEIAASLARIRGLIVISSGSVAAAVAARRNLRDELGLDFLLEGTLMRSAERLRIAVKLVDAESGAVNWTTSFEYNHGDLFQVQRDVAALVAAGLEPEIPIIAAAQIKRRGEAGGAYELMLRAIPRIHLLDRSSFIEAGEFLEQAIGQEPDYSPAYSWLALWNAFLVGQGWARDPRASIARAGDLAEHAVMLDANDARGLAIAGHVRAFLYRRIDEALALHERALAINPSLPLAWHFSGVAQAYAGNLEEARSRLERCQTLAPRDPHSFFAEGAAIIVELLSRNHRAAVTIGRRVTQLHPRFSAAYKPYLAALGHLGETQEAALVYRRLLQLEPDFTVRSFRATSPFVLREHIDHYVAGLSAAGVP